MYRLIDNQTMIKSRDKEFVYDLVTLLGAKQTKQKLLEKIISLSATDDESDDYKYYGLIKSQYIKNYGELLHYLEKEFREQLSK